LAAAGAAPSVALAGGLHAAFWVCVVLGAGCLLAVLGLRHAAVAEVPVKQFVPFGKLHHPVVTR
jgi:hypothetical protein